MCSQGARTKPFSSDSLIFVVFFYGKQHSLQLWCNYSEVQKKFYSKRNKNSCLFSKKFWFSRQPAFKRYLNYSWNNVRLQLHLVNGVKRIFKLLIDDSIRKPETWCSHVNSHNWNFDIFFRTNCRCCWEKYAENVLSVISI